MDLDSVSSKEYYGRRKVARDYDSKRFTTSAGKMLDSVEKRMVMINLPEDSENCKVLDAGAGSGRFALEIAGQNYDVTACDYSLAMLEVIKSKISDSCLKDRILLLREDITGLSLRDDEFDFVCSMRVFVNLDSKENIEKGLRELVRVCKPGGRIVFDIVNPKSLAALGPKKDSMITLGQAKDLISSIPNARISYYAGSRILSQTSFEKSPRSLLRFVDILDLILSRAFPSLCVRIYFVLAKDE